MPLDVSMEVRQQIYELPYSAGLGAFLGHIYPVWLRFVGGKGVATFIGVLLGAVLRLLRWSSAWSGRWSPPGTRYSSLAALSGTAAVVLFYLAFGQAGLLFISHHGRPHFPEA